MFDIGGPELILIIVIALVVVGPRRLPEVGRQFGRGLAMVRRASREMRTNLEREVALEQVREDARSISRSIEREVEEAGVDRELGEVRKGLTGLVEPDGEPGAPGPRPSAETPDPSAGERPTGAGEKDPA